MCVVERSVSLKYLSNLYLGKMGSEGFVYTVWETPAAQKFGGYTVVSTYSLDKHIAPLRKTEKHKSCVTDANFK